MEIGGGDWGWGLLNRQKSESPLMKPRDHGLSETFIQTLKPTSFFLSQKFTIGDGICRISGDMDPDEALGLVKEGATLLLLDVPRYTLVGIDTQVFSVGPAFKGIKMVPPGLHFVYYCSSNREGVEFSPLSYSEFVPAETDPTPISSIPYLFLLPY